MKVLNKFKTNWSITVSFFAVLIIIVIIELFLNTLIFSRIVIYSRNLSYFNPEKFTLNFSNYISIDGGIPYLKTDAKDELIKKNAWIQIIDDNFGELYSFHKPHGVPLKYNPIEFAGMYKYDVQKKYTVFISKKALNNENFTYIIGFPLSVVAKHTLVFNPDSLKFFFWNGFVLLIVVDVFAAVVLSYALFGKRTGKILEDIINGISNLSCGNYKIKYAQTGVYKNVFVNLNKLAAILMENKNKRKELDEMRDTWISSISHDIKTPLSSVKGYSELMMDAGYNFSIDEMRDYSKIINDKSLYMESLISDLNLTYKLKSGVFALNAEEVNLVQFLQDLIIKILNDPLYSNRNINFNASEENITYCIDKSLFKRSLVNLIFNSIVHNDEDVKIDISIFKKEKIYIIIEDNGKGISEGDLGHIFERYYRGTNTSSSSESSGLGLAIAKEVIDIHKGSISIESKLDAGTRITITLG